MKEQLLVRAISVAVAAAWMSPALAHADEERTYSKKTSVEQTGPAEQDETVTTKKSTTTVTNPDANLDVPSDSATTPETSVYKSSSETVEHRNLTEPYTPTPARYERKAPELGASVELGGGITNFTNGILNEMADVGGGWGARLTVGTRSIVALEAAYQGSAQAINALGLDSGATLLSNAAQGDVRLNFTTSNIQPFVYGGAAYKRYNLVGTDTNTSDVTRTDGVFEIPAGVGVSFRYDQFVAEPRFDYRWSFDDELVNTFNASGERTSNLDNWNLSANIGMEF